MLKDGCVDIHLRLRQDTDPELFAWVRSLDEVQALPRGGKAIAIKRVLLAGLQGQEQPQPASGGMAWDEALPGLLRRVVEAAILDVLPEVLRGAGWAGVVEPRAVDPPEDDGELLAALEQSLLLPET